MLGMILNLIFITLLVNIVTLFTVLTVTLLNRIKPKKRSKK